MHTAYVMRAVAAATIIATSIALVAAPLNPDTCTEADIRAVVAEALSQTNATTQRVYTHLRTNGLFRSSRLLVRFPGVFVELDATLAERGLAPHGWWYAVRTWPKCSELARKATGADVAYPQTVAIAKRLGVDLGLSTIATRGTLDDVAIALSEAVAFPEACSLPSFAVAKPKIQKLALAAIKVHLRSQGKSFVTKNGVNPCESYMTGLTEALNAPRFAGLDAWFKSVGLSGVDLSRLPSEEDVSKLKDDIFYGRKDMDGRAKAILEVCLGVEGYNKFVKEYNGN
jgi:hypothetical protein